MEIWRFTTAILLTFSVASLAVAHEPGLSITYLKRSKIADKSEGLKEPSGLALSHGGKSLWTISDDAKIIYKLGIDGVRNRSDYFKIDSKGLEGITLDSDGDHLYAVQESKNAIIKINVTSETESETHRLSEMQGFSLVEDDFEVDQNNKGLEGITLMPSGDLLVIKEGGPGLLVEVSADLAEIRSVVRLDRDRGFFDDDTEPEAIDFSGICYDNKRNLLWIVSDKAKRVYLFDRAINQVTQSFALGYGQRGEYQEIKKAEGITIDPDTDRLYIVSDEEARLYIYQVR